jgi:hypothetical protein
MDFYCICMIMNLELIVGRVQCYYLGYDINQLLSPTIYDFSTVFL